MLKLFQAPTLTRRRVALAMLVAVTADAVQVGLGPMGWTFLDEVIDVVAMIAISSLVGFHPLLLPTFVIEFIPVVDMLPTWTACVSGVLLLRRRQEPASMGASSHAPPPPPSGDPSHSSPIIDV